MWAWRMMMMMMMTLVALVMPRGGSALPTGSTNDRPIIGILAQEINGPLAGAVAEILAEAELPQFASAHQDELNVSERDMYNGEDHPSIPEELLDDGIMEPESKVPEEGGLSTPEPLHTTTKPPLPLLPKNASYIGASYVKFVEAAGARVVPIFVNRERDYYEELLKSVNGVLFPGGDVAIDETSGYGRAGKIIYEIAQDMNNKGKVFPLWGTCLGFELMMGLAANGQEVRIRCDAQNIASHVKLDVDFANGHLLRHLPKRLLKAITTEPITSNFHHYCLTPKNFSTFGLDRTYRPLAYSSDRRGVEYVAAVESREYPFFAVQFHPEKSPYEWTTKPGHDQIAHSSAAIDTANYFAQVFVNYARRNKNRFSSAEEEDASLIYNYTPLYTGQHASIEQTYIF